MIYNINIASFGSQIITENEMLELIGQAKIAELKKSDPHPYFRAFTIAHEGEATPLAFTDNAADKIALEFSRDAIKSMNGRMLGTAIVEGDHEFEGGGFKGTGRKKIGYEVARVQKEIGGKLHEIGIFYSSPEKRERLRAKDRVSMEAAFDVFRRGTKWIAGKFRGLYRVASAALEDGFVPAFPGAVAVADVAAWSSHDDRMMLLAMSEWTPEQFLKELNDEQKKRLTDSLNLQKQPKEVKRVPNQNQIVINIDEDGRPTNPSAIPFNTLVSLVRARKALISQMIDLEDGEGFGKKSVKIVDGRRVVDWIGGDHDAKKWLQRQIDEENAPYIEQIAELQKQLNAANDTKNVFSGALGNERSEILISRIRKSITDRAEKMGMSVAARKLLEFNLNNNRPLPPDFDVAALGVAGDEKKIAEMNERVAKIEKEFPETYLKQFAEQVAPAFADNNGQQQQSSEQQPEEFKLPPELTTGAQSQSSPSSSSTKNPYAGIESL